MRRPPEVRRFGFVAYNRQCIADDTDHFLQHVDPDAAGWLAGCREAVGSGGSPGARLREMGLRCEERFLEWRAREPHAALAATRVTQDAMAGQVEEFLPRIAVGLVRDGHRALTERAMGRAEELFGYLSSVGVLSRAADRLSEDSHGYDPGRLSEMLEVSNAAFEEDREGDRFDYHRLRRMLERDDDAWAERALGHAPSGAEARRQERRERRVLVRSVKVSEQFVGVEPTRLFVSGQAIRVTGRLATYEVRRERDLMSDHGGASLSVLSRDGGTFLCRLCVYTRGVPLLDHLTSIFVHVRAGQEERILAEGNPFDASPEAREEPWLVPHLDRDGIRGRPARERDGRDMPHRPILRDLAAHFFGELGDRCPPMPETRNMLERGFTTLDMVFPRDEGPDVPMVPVAGIAAPAAHA